MTDESVGDSKVNDNVDISASSIVAKPEVIIKETEIKSQTEKPVVETETKESVQPDTAKDVDGKTDKVEQQVETTPIPVVPEEVVVAKEDVPDQTAPESAEDSEDLPDASDNDALMNGHDSNNKSAFVGKQSFFFLFLSFHFVFSMFCVTI